MKEAPKTQVRTERVRDASGDRVGEEERTGHVTWQIWPGTSREYGPGDLPAGSFSRLAAYAYASNRNVYGSHQAMGARDLPAQSARTLA